MASSAGGDILPPPSTLPSLGDSERAAALDLLFEPSPALHAQVLNLASKPHESYDALIDAVHATLTQLANSGSELDRSKRLDAILSAHPRLGAAEVDSAQSRAEQARLNDGQTEQAEKLAKLNREYEETFPGLRYVVFVNGRGRDEIMENMQTRMKRGDIDEERKEAIQAMCDIAKDRAKKLQMAGSGKS